MHGGQHALGAAQGGPGCPAAGRRQPGCQRRQACGQEAQGDRLSPGAVGFWSGLAWRAALSWGGAGPCKALRRRQARPVDVTCAASQAGGRGGHTPCRKQKAAVTLQVVSSPGTASVEAKAEAEDDGGAVKAARYRSGIDPATCRHTCIGQFGWVWGAWDSHTERLRTVLMQEEGPEAGLGAVINSSRPARSAAQGGLRRCWACKREPVQSTCSRRDRPARAGQQDL